MNKSYKSLLNKLFEVNLHGGVKLGLSNIKSLNEALGNPMQYFKCIHVAGTNGKGSVVTKIAQALEFDGYRVGLYTSPHISTFRERIKVNNRLIEEQNTIDLLEKIFNIIETEKIPATFFEITTALALAYFASQKVDYAVLEAGLGGRLDATNIVLPQLSIITSISFEHTEYLGNTLEEITTEKGGIIKPHVPILIGPCVPKSVIETIAKKQNSPLIQVVGHFLNYDDENNAIARRALQLLDVKEKSIDEALKIRPPCRMELLHQNPPVILDVGHNPDGLEHLLQAATQQYPQTSFRIVFGLSKNKDIDGCLNVLKRFGDHFYLVEAPNGRGLPITELLKKMREHDFEDKSISIEGSITNSIQEAIKAAKKHNQTVIICGTFFIMSEARATLGIKEPRDDFDLNEKPGPGTTRPWTPAKGPNRPSALPNNEI